MKKNLPLNKMLCLHFCAYYKPGRNEQLACRGYEVVDRLMQAGKIPPLDNAGSDFDRIRAESMVKVMCSACGFQKDGCDFMLDRSAPPCGGFVLLAQLIETGAIVIEDVS
jgi:hypothetical protein